MGDTTLLNLDTIAAGQQSMYQTSNDADNQLERAMNDVLLLTVNADKVVTTDQFTRNFTIQISGNASVFNVTIPQSKRFFSVENTGSASVNIVLGTTSLAVAAGDSALFYSDGTANGLKALVSSTSGPAGTAGGDLTGTYPDPTIANTAVTYAKIQNIAANSVIGNPTGSSAAATEVPIGSANGVASLDSGGKIPLSQLPAAVAGALSYQGTWNASTNSPALASGTGTKGYYYKVGTAGTTTIDGISDWAVGDSIVFDGTTWDKLNGADPEVLSVCSKHGAVTLAASDLTDGTTGAGGAIVLATGPTMTNPVVGTQSPGDNSTKAASTAYVDAAIGGGAAPTGAAGGDLAGSFPNPTIATGSVTDTKGSLSVKPVVDRVTTTNQASLSGLPTIDGAAMTDGQILMLTGQSTASQNGPQVVHSGAWTRPTWYPASGTTQAFQGSTVAVASGDFYAGSIWRLTTSGAITIDTTGTAWSPIGKRYDLDTFLPGAQTSASQLVRRHHALRALTIGTAGHKASAGVAATGSTTFTFYKNGASFGTAVWSASGTVATITVSASVTIAVDDIITIKGPATADATLADITIILACTG